MNIDLNCAADSDEGSPEGIEMCEPADSDRGGSDDNLLRATTDDQGGSSDEILKEEGSLREGSRSWTPPPRGAYLEALEMRLQPGSIVQSMDDAYGMYCEYARLRGFSVKKGTQSYFARSGDIKMKMYHCSCEGLPDGKASASKIPAFRKQAFRTECKARLRIVRERDGPWRVAVHHDEHNHEMLRPDMTYLLRSARHLDQGRKEVIKSLNDAGIGVSRACRWLERESGGRENLGFTRMDAYHHINTLKGHYKIENGDAESLLEYFSNKEKSDPHFFWDKQRDDEGRLTSLFFRDCQCAEDYELFGDVITVDTTFKTNKYNLICAPFVGMNHHRQNVMFGMAFLSDEKTKSFQWLFKTFLNSMKGKEPQVIFSDQDQAMMNGIDYTFRSAAHRLCQWHINQNATSHFGVLNGNRAFKRMWHHCMSGCETEEELGTYGLQKIRWFKSMYNLRARWADVFTRHRFSGGMHATSRSEATNRVIKQLCRSTGSLHEFVVQYERMLTDWRQKEREEDALCRGVPGQLAEHNHLMQHAAEVYTRTVYKIFEREAASSLSVAVISTTVNNVSGESEYRVTSNCSSTKTRTVVYNPEQETVSCTCPMMETEGIFCRHMMKVFYTINLQSLPEKHILRRWTREVKKSKPSTFTRNLSSQTSLTENLFVSSIMRRTYNLCMECKEDEKRRSLLEEGINRVTEEVIKVKASDGSDRGDCRGEQKVPRSRTFKDPRQTTHQWLPLTREKKPRTEERSRKQKSNAPNTDARSRPRDSQVRKDVPDSRNKRNKRTNNGEDTVHTETNMFREIGTQSSRASLMGNDTFEDGTDDVFI